MNLGRFQIDIFSDGEFKIDGGAMFGVVPKVFWDKLKAPDPLTRLKAVRTLPERKADAAQVVPALIEALKDEDAEVRRGAAFGLGSFGEQARDATPALRAALRDRTHWGWAFLATSILGTIGAVLQIPAGEHVVAATFAHRAATDPQMQSLSPEKQHQALQFAIAIDEQVPAVDHVLA